MIFNIIFVIACSDSVAQKHISDYYVETNVVMEIKVYTFDFTMASFNWETSICDKLIVKNVCFKLNTNRELAVLNQH